MSVGAAREVGTRAERWAALSREREQVLRSLRRRFGDFPDAEDVVDEAMLRLLDHPDLVNQRVAALLYTAAHNLNIDRHRRGARHQRFASQLSPHRSVSPDDLAVVREQLNEALDCVAGMSQREQQALAGRVLGYRPAETAAILGVSPTSVYQALSRARSTLRSALGGAAALLLLLRRNLAPVRHAAGTLSAAAVSATLVAAVNAPLPAASRAAVQVVGHAALSPLVEGAAPSGQSADRAGAAPHHGAAAGTVQPPDTASSAPSTAWVLPAAAPDAAVTLPALPTISGVTLPAIAGAALTTLPSTAAGALSALPSTVAGTLSAPGFLAAVGAPSIDLQDIAAVSRATRTGESVTLRAAADAGQGIAGAA